MDTLRNPLGDKPFSLVIFDCDGVLVDSEVISCGAVADVLTRHGVPTDIEAVLRKFLGRPASAVTEYYTSQTNAPLPGDFISGWRSNLFARFEKELTAIRGIQVALEAIDLPRCVASSGDEERIGVSLRKASLWEQFEGNIFSTTMVKHGKPAPDLFLFAAERMGVDPSRCLVVEDSESGIRAAKAAGMTAVGFTGGSHYAVLDNTASLRSAGADHIISNAAELPLLLKATPADG